MTSAIVSKSIWMPGMGTVNAVRLRLDDVGTISWGDTISYGFALQSQDVGSSPATYSDITGTGGTTQLTDSQYPSFTAAADASYIMSCTATNLGVTLSA